MPKIVADDVVFDAVLSVVVAHGYSGATTKSIAELADVNEATLFRKYGSKAQMVLQAVENLVMRTDILSLVSYTGDVRADLLQVLEALFRAEDANGDVFLVLIAEVHRHPELEGLIHTPLKLFSHIGQLLARYQAEGVLRQEHPMQAVLAFIAPISMSRRLRSLGGAGRFPKLDAVGYVDGYLGGRMLTQSA